MSISPVSDYLSKDSNQIASCSTASSNAAIHFLHFAFMALTRGKGSQNCNIGRSTGKLPSVQGCGPQLLATDFVPRAPRKCLQGNSADPDPQAERRFGISIPIRIPNAHEIPIVLDCSMRRWRLQRSPSAMERVFIVTGSQTSSHVLYLGLSAGVQAATVLG
jgi:hypothetical protein